MSMLTTNMSNRQSFVEASKVYEGHVTPIAYLLDVENYKYMSLNNLTTGQGKYLCKLRVNDEKKGT